MSRHLITDDDSADRGGCYRLDIIFLKPFGDHRRKPRGYLRRFERDRTLKICFTMKPAREDEVTFEQRTRFAKHFNHVVILQIDQPFRLAYLKVSKFRLRKLESFR